MRCLSDNIPDESYDFLIKQEEQKDGLDVYKPKQIIKFYSQIKCPLCKIKLTKEEELEINNILETGIVMKLLSKIDEYNNEAKSETKIDNFEELKILYNQMQDYAKILEKNRYYKHTCKNNEICQRNENQDVYIDLCFDSPQNIIEKNMEINFKKLKSNEKYRNKYLSEKEVAYNNYIREKTKKKLNMNILMISKNILLKKNKKSMNGL